MSDVRFCLEAAADSLSRGVPPFQRAARRPLAFNRRRKHRGKPRAPTIHDAPQCASSPDDKRLQVRACTSER